MIAYFTQAAVVASQLAGATHQGFSRCQRNKKNKNKTNNANQAGASRMRRDVKQLQQEPRPGAPPPPVGFPALTWKKTARAKQCYQWLVKTKQKKERGKSAPWSTHLMLMMQKLSDCQWRRCSELLS